MLHLLLATLALTLASLVAVFASERAASRITGRRGWALTCALLVIGVLALRPTLAWGEALATATVWLMALLPLGAAALGWHRRRAA